MTRWQALKLINDLGFPISKDYFDKLCLPSRKSGPPVAARWGLRPMYDADAVRDWAMARSQHPADVAA
jgi:hypothetical protein